MTGFRNNSFYFGWRARSRDCLRYRYAQCYYFGQSPRLSSFEGWWSFFQENMQEIRYSIWRCVSSCTLPWAHLPPVGYTACNRYMCMAGCVPSFNQFICAILQLMKLAPAQVHLNSCALLNNMYMIFVCHSDRKPSSQKIRYLYSFKCQKGSLSLIFLVLVGTVG